MSYSVSAARLNQLFAENDYEGRMKSKGPQVTVTVETLSNGSRIQVVFPGYKAKPGFLDYRVELVKDGITTPLSHMNIVVDLVHKCAQGIDVDGLRAALERHAVEGNLDYQVLAQLLPYQPGAPSTELRSRAGNPRGNEHDLTLEELFSAIHWIALQEDFNYPIANRKSGRKMPYYRYAEALHGVKHGHPTIQELIPRTNFKGFPPPLWTGVDYSFTHKIQ